MQYYVGLDVSLKQTSICVVDQTGLVVREGVVDSDPEAISVFVRSKAPDAVRIGLETGPTSTWLSKAYMRGAIKLDLFPREIGFSDACHCSGLAPRGVWTRACIDIVALVVFLKEFQSDSQRYQTFRLGHPRPFLLAIEINSTVNGYSRCRIISSFITSRSRLSRNGIMRSKSDPEKRAKGCSFVLKHFTFDHPNYIFHVAHSVCHRSAERCIS